MVACDVAIYTNNALREKRTGNDQNPKGNNTKRRHNLVGAAAIYYEQAAQVLFFFFRMTSQRSFADVDD